MTMKHVIHVLLNLLGLFKVLKWACLQEKYFYHLIYIAKIQYCATLVMSEIKIFEI